MIDSTRVWKAFFAGKLLVRRHWVSSLETDTFIPRGSITWTTLMALWLYKVSPAPILVYSGGFPAWST